MPLDTATRQRLLELAYELLPEAEAAALRERIAADAELAEAFAAAQRQATVIAAAAKLSSPPLVFSPPRPAVEPRSTPPSPRLDRDSTSRLAHWSVVAAALLLAAVSLGGYFYHERQMTALGAAQIRLFVAGPPRMQAGAPAEFTVVATDTAGAPVDTEVELSLLAADDRTIWHTSHSTDADGRFRAIVPARLALADGARLLVSAGEGERSSRISTPLATAPAEYTTRLTTDRRQYRAGETVYCRSVSLSRFALKAEREFALRFELLDPKGKSVAGSRVEGLTEHGVGNAALALPAHAVAGQYKLSVRALDDTIPTTTLALAVDGAAPPDKVESPAVESDDAEPLVVRFYPEGGELAAELENRVYFTACDKTGKPVDLSGRVVDAAGREVALVDVQRDGKGFFRFRPTGNRQYRLKILEPKGIAQQPKLPTVAIEQRVVLSAGTGVFAAGRPLEFNVRAAKEGLPLVAVARCRGVAVAQQPLVTSVSAGGANPVSLSVPPEVSGVVRLTLYDYSAAPPEPIAERLIYRRPLQRLTLRAEGAKSAYAPGEKVELTVSIADEQGRAAAATLGALATFERAALSPSLAADLLLLDDMDDPQSLEDADFLLGDDSKAEAALDLILGTHGWRRFVAAAVADGGEQNKPQNASLAAADAPLVVDNLKQLRKEYESRLADYRAQRGRWLSSLATLCAFGGIALLLSLAMLGLLRLVAGAPVWTTAVAATVCALVVAAALVERGGSLGGSEMAVAFAPYEAPAAPPAANEKETPRRELAAAAPPAPGVPAVKGGGRSGGQGEARALASSPPAMGAAVRKADDSTANRRSIDKVVEKVESQATNGARQRDASPVTDRGVNLKAVPPRRSFAVREFAREPEFAKQSRPSTPTLLWRPLIAADASGTCRLVFQLPETPGDCWLAVDAHGDGRLGELRIRLTVAAKDRPE